MNDCGWNRCRVGDSYQGVGKGTGGVSYLIVFFFLLVLLSSILLCPVSFFK